MGERLVLSKETLEQQVKSGMTLDRMSKIHGCSISSIHRKLNEMGIEYKDSRKKLNVEDVSEMLEQGCRNDDIAKKYGCHYKTVEDFIKRHELSKIRVRKYSQNIEELKSGSATICKPKVLNKTAQKCIYGGKCGNCDCCDKLILTGKRRKYDPENPNICYDFVAATPKQKEQFRMAQLGRHTDVLIYGKGV